MRSFLATLIIVSLIFTINFHSLVSLIIGAILIIGLLTLDLSNIYSKDPVVYFIFSPRGLNILLLAIVTYGIGFYYNLASQLPHPKGWSL